MKLPHSFAVLLAGVLIGAMHFPSSVDAENWPGWRGPQGDGTCGEKDVPKRWDVATAAWKIEMPGIGHASPIIWGDRVFTVTAFPEKLDRVLLCFDRATGKILWQRTVVHGPLEKINRENSYASGTTFDLVAKYELGEPCYASPAISDGQVFLRGFKHLFCIGQRVQ
jgi:outer membrane protein assembly factor BamB